MKKIISMLLVVTAFTPVLSASAAPRKPLPCRHHHTVTVYSYSKYTPVKNNPNAHMETKYYNKQCKSCRKTIAKNIKGATKKENHSFRGNKCTDCGAVKKVHPVKPHTPIKPQKPVKPPVVKPQAPVKKHPVVKPQAPSKKQTTNKNMNKR